ncbi:MAG: hypothetical protein K2J73_12745 [Oscillospiraceae bacterium]|nr:hypothetical protein [Oscillospiraceae bacterium]
MNVQAVTACTNNTNRSCSAKISQDVPAFTIPWDTERSREKIVFQSGSDVDPVSAMESMTGKISVSEPSYSVTDEEAEYFREKYVDTYDENKVQELYRELADKGAISFNDACRGSNTIMVIPLGAVKNVVYFGTHLPGREFMSPLGSFSALSGEAAYVKDVSRTDENAYKREWEAFKAQYDTEIVSWKDSLQESIDFERYLKRYSRKNDALTQWHFDNVIEGLEKTKDVILQIFG